MADNPSEPGAVVASRKSSLPLAIIALLIGPSTPFLFAAAFYMDLFSLSFVALIPLAPIAGLVVSILVRRREKAGPRRKTSAAAFAGILVNSGVLAAIIAVAGYLFFMKIAFERAQDQLDKETTQGLKALAETEDLTAAMNEVCAQMTLTVISTLQDDRRREKGAFAASMEELGWKRPEKTCEEYEFGTDGKSIWAKAAPGAKVAHACIRFDLAGGPQSHEGCP